MRRPEGDATHAELLEQQAFLRRLARHLVADEHAALDLVQDASVAALERAPHGLASMRGWLARVLRNRAANASRDERHRAARELDTARERDAARPELPQTPDEVAQHLAVQRRVLAAVEALSEPYRTTIYLRYYADLGPSAIAERTGAPLATVKARLARGLARLRAELDGEHDGDRSAWALCLAGTFDVGRDTAIGASVAAGGTLMGATMVSTKWIAALLSVALAWWIGASVVERAAAPAASGTVAVDPAPAVAALEPATMLARPETASERAVLPAPVVEPEPEALASAWRLRLELHGLTVGSGEAMSIAIDFDNNVAVPDESFTAAAAPQMELDVSSIFAGKPRPPTMLSLRLDHPRYLPVRVGVNVPLPADVPSEMDVKVELVQPSGIVSGLAFAPAGIDPHRIHLELYALAAGRPAITPIDTARGSPDGKYRLRAGAAHEHVLVAWIEAELGEHEYQARPAMFRPENRSVVLVDGKCEPAPIGFDRGALIAGRVEFPEGGDFLGKIEVSIAPYGEDIWPHSLAWREGRFVLGEMHAAWDESRSFLIEGLAEADYGVWALGAPPPPVPSVRAFRALSIDDVEPAVQVAAPQPNLVLSIVRPRHSFLVSGAGAPIAGASFEVEYAGPNGTHGTRGLRTNADGRIDVLLDKGQSLVVRASHPGFMTRKLELTPAELAAGGMIEIELQENGPPATLEIMPAQPGWPDGVAYQLVLHDLDALGQTSTAIAKQQTPMNIAVLPSGSHGLMQIPRSHTVKMKDAVNGSWHMDDVPPGSYFLRIVAQSASFDVPCYYLPVDFDLQLAPGAYRTLVWQPQLGGVLRLDIHAAEFAKASLLDAQGEKCALTYLRQGTGLGDMMVGPGPLIPGRSLAHPAIPAGAYTLRIEAPGGAHDVPLTIEAGRVTDLEIDLDDL